MPQLKNSLRMMPTNIKVFLRGFEKQILAFARAIEIQKENWG